MIASKDNLKVGNTIIFKCDEWRDGHQTDFDGQVQFINDKGVDVIYLSGFRSRNDFIPWKDIIAKVDKRRKYVELSNASYAGKFFTYE